MAYVSKVWVDRQTEYPTRRKLAFDDGTGDKIVTVSREEGQIYEAGDIFDANTMNNMESRIAAGIAEKQDILIPGNGIRIDQDNVISATGGGGGIEFTKVESGSLVSVNDAADLPVVDLAVEIKAIQSGTGDPSPSNVRPISGWSEINVARCAVNVWNEQREQGGIGQNTGADTSTAGYYRSIYIPVKAGFTYYLKTPIRMMGFYYDANKTFLSRFEILANGGTFTTPPDTAFIRFRNTNANEWDTYGNDVSVNYPSTDTAYHAYTGTTATINLGQTVYGGERNITSGLQTVRHGTVLFDGSESWSKNGETDDYINLVSTVSDLVSVANSDTVVRIKADKFNGVSAYTALGAATKAAYQIAAISNNRVYVVMPKTVVDSAAAFKTWLESNNVQIVYELAQPITVQQSGTELETLLGIDNIWADSGDILNLEYYTQSASDVRDFIIKDEEITDDASWSSEKIQDELDAKQETLTAGDGIVFDGNEISAVLYKELTATLNVFSTSVVFEDSSITTSSVIDIYTSKYGFNPETVTAETGRLTITFRQPEEQITVKVRIS